MHIGGRHGQARVAAIARHARRAGGDSVHDLVERVTRPARF
jgi:hypothetical protein